MNKVVIGVRGIVQKVGFRAAVKDIADDLGVCGTVENRDDDSVRIVCEAEQVAINEMIRRMKSDTAPAVVDEITVDTSSEATGMTGFRIITADNSTEMLAAIHAGIRELKSVNKVLVRMDTTQNEMRDTQNEMKGTLNEIKDTQNEMSITIKSIDNKMDSSLNNDAEMLEILRSMRDGGLLRVSK